MTERDETYLGEAWAVSATMGGERVWLVAYGWGKERSRRNTYTRERAAYIVRCWGHDRPELRPRLVRITYWRGTW